jgi:hypothetical protein
MGVKRKRSDERDEASENENERAKTLDEASEKPNQKNRKFQVKIEVEEITREEKWQENKIEQPDEKLECDILNAIYTKTNKKLHNDICLKLRELIKSSTRKTFYVTH